MVLCDKVLCTEPFLKCWFCAISHCKNGSNGDGKKWNMHVKSCKNKWSLFGICTKSSIICLFRCSIKVANIQRHSITDGRPAYLWARVRIYYYIMQTPLFKTRRLHAPLYHIKMCTNKRINFWSTSTTKLSTVDSTISRRIAAADELLRILV